MTTTDAAEPAPDPRRLRTFTSLLQDNVPMPAAVAARMRALDDDANPRLDEMRHAMGFGVNFTGTWDAVRAHPGAFRADAADADLVALLDALYGAIAGSRVVHAEVRGEAPAARREPGAIAMREGEPLRLLIVWRNTLDAPTDVSAEARGFGAGMTLAPGRTDAMLVDAGPLPAGSYLLPLLLVAGGQPATLDLPIECAPSGELAVRIVDDETGERIAARIYIEDDTGPLAPDDVVLRRDIHRQAWFHADGAFTARVAGRARLRVARGIEYEHAEAPIAVPADGRIEHTVRLRRWSHMAADGWYSGDVHVHLNYGGELALLPADAALAQRAEDVHLLNMMVANGGEGGIVLDDEHFSGAPHALSEPGHILRWGEEYRNNLYGHLCLCGIERLTEPVFTGVPSSAQPHDWPANAHFARAARDAGGTISYAHPLFEGGIELDRIFAEARSVEAKELPVDAALGRIDAVDVLSYPGSNLDVARLWYRLLNCGLRLAATAGSDTFMNMDDVAEMLGFGGGRPRFTSPPAGVRVFARIDGELTTESWCAAVRAGRTFITNGPMLALTVNGEEIGSVLDARPGETLRVEAAAGSYAPMERLELIVDGAIVAAAEAAAGARQLRLDHELPAERHCWIALRATGAEHQAVLDDAAFAHTSPVYVSVPGAPRDCRAEARYFAEWIDRLCAMTRERGRFASPEQLDDVLALFAEGRAFYAALAG